MEKCPICKRKLISTVFDIFGEKHCPVHGEFLPYEKNNTKYYFEFKSNIYSLKDLMASLRYFTENKDKNREIKNYYSDNEIVIIYEERINNLVEKILYSTSIITYVYLKKYFYNNRIDINTINTNYKDIIDKNKLHIYDGSNLYDILKILDELKNYLEQPDKNSVINNSELFQDIINNTEIKKENILELFNKTVYIIKNNEGNEYAILSINNKGKIKKSKQYEEEILNNPINKINTNTAGMVYYEYLIDKIIDVIRQIDLDIQKNNKRRNK